MNWKSIIFIISSVIKKIKINMTFAIVEQIKIEKKKIYFPKKKTERKYVSLIKI